MISIQLKSNRYDVLAKVMQSLAKWEWRFSYEVVKQMAETDEDEARMSTENKCYQAADFVEALIATNEIGLSRSEIQDNLTIKDDIRRCDACGKPMKVGYCIDGGCAHFCSPTCLHAHYTEVDYLEKYDNGKGDSYWTEWETWYVD